MPPEAPYYHAVRDLAAWVQELDPLALSELCHPAPGRPVVGPDRAPRARFFLLAGNYAEHIVERGALKRRAGETFPFSCFCEALDDHTGRTRVTRSSFLGSRPDHIDWECELGIIVGRTCRDVDEADALEYVAGYTVVNDVSDRKFTPNPDRKVRDRDRFFRLMHGKWHGHVLPGWPPAS